MDDLTPLKNNLTAKQEQFCQEYLVDLNAAGAARRAGYSEKSDDVIGWENLRKPEIQARIAELRKEAANGLNMTRERILQELSRVGLFDVRKIHGVDGAILPIREWGDDEAAAVAGIEVEELTVKDDAGDDMEIGRLKKVKMNDKLRALEMIAKMLGYNAPDKIAATDPEGNAVTPQINIHFPEGYKPEAPEEFK